MGIRQAGLPCQTLALGEGSLNELFWVSQCNLGALLRSGTDQGSELGLCPCTQILFFVNHLEMCFLLPFLIAGCSSGNVSAGPPLPWPVGLTRSLFSAVYSPSNLLCNWQGMSGTFSCHLRGSREHRVSLALKAPWRFWVKNPKY